MQHHGAALRKLTGDPEYVHALATEWRAAAKGTRLRALLEYAERLTREPASVRREHVERLREAGLDDEAILHACEIVAYFNYVNRTADGLGVTLEEGWTDPIYGRYRG